MILLLCRVMKEIDLYLKNQIILLKKNEGDLDMTFAETPKIKKRSLFYISFETKRLLSETFCTEMFCFQEVFAIYKALKLQEYCRIEIV